MDKLAVPNWFPGLTVVRRKRLLPLCYKRQTFGVLGRRSDRHSDVGALLLVAIFGHETYGRDLRELGDSSVYRTHVSTRLTKHSLLFAAGHIGSFKQDSLSSAQNLTKGLDLTAFKSSIVEANMELNEKARLQALRRYKILDTDPERAFDDLTVLASHICETPVA